MFFEWTIEFLFPQARGVGSQSAPTSPFFVIIVLKVAAKGDVMDLVLADRSFSFA